MLAARHLIALSVLTASASMAGAQTAAPDRSAVKAEARAAVKGGTTADGEKERDVAPPAARTTSSRPRTEVKAEARSAGKGGATAKGELPYKGNEATATATSGKSRADVKTEAKASIKAGDGAGRGETSYGGPPKSPAAVGR